MDILVENPLQTVYFVLVNWQHGILLAECTVYTEKLVISVYRTGAETSVQMLLCMQQSVYSKNKNI